MNRGMILIGMILIDCFSLTGCQGTNDPFVFMRSSKLKRDGKSICDFKEIDVKPKNGNEKNALRFVQEIGRNGEILHQWEKVCFEAKVVSEKPMGKKSAMHKNIWIAVRYQNLESLEELLEQCTSEDEKLKFINKYPLLLHFVIKFYIKSLENIKKDQTIIFNISKIVEALSQFGYSMDSLGKDGETPRKLLSKFYNQYRYKM